MKKYLVLSNHKLNANPILPLFLQTNSVDGFNQFTVGINHKICKFANSPKDFAVHQSVAYFGLLKA